MEPHKAKLKDSCGSCSLSKVRCSRGKPKCSRCERKGLKCEYTLAKRAGRTSTSANKGGAAASSRHRPPTSPGSLSQPEGSQDRESTPDRALPAETVEYDPVAQDTNFYAVRKDSMMSITHDHGVDIPTFDVSNPEQDPWSAVISPTQQNSMDLDELLDATRLEISSPTLDMDGAWNNFTFSSLDNTYAGTVNIPSLLQESKQENTTSCSSCLSDLNVYLSKLFSRAWTTCATTTSDTINTSSTGNSIESVLQVNRTIIEGITRILSCSCSHDDYLLAFISLVVLKVMAWYAAAARGAFHSESSDQEELVGRTSPLAVHFPDESQRRMMAQMVLSELHRAQRLVKLLSERREESRHQRFKPSSPGFRKHWDILEDSAGSDSPSEAAIDRLVSDLGQRLNRLSVEVIGLLKQA
ncbi:Aflatoxin regulatory protein-like protein [Elsinoe fawcettii]|nr:Aflatoxin regulatory protein-like protein [Elsinoe fawcettii]